MSINCVRQFGSDHAESSSHSKSCLSYASQRFSVARALSTVQLSRPQVKSKSFVMFWSRVALGIEKPLTWTSSKRDDHVSFNIVYQCFRHVAFVL